MPWGDSLLRWSESHTRFYIAVVASPVLHRPGWTPGRCPAYGYISGTASVAAVQRDLDVNREVIDVIEVKRCFAGFLTLLGGNSHLQRRCLGEGTALQPTQVVGEHILKRDAVLAQYGLSRRPLPAELLS